jgi:hypothetical protein
MDRKEEEAAKLITMFVGRFLTVADVAIQN